MPSVSPEVTLTGHVCIDHNRTNDGPAVKKWGSAVLYIAEYMHQAHGIKPHIIAPYGPDLAEYTQDLILDINPPTETHTLVYKNTITHGSRTQSCENIDATSPVALTDHMRSRLATSAIFIAAPLTPNLSSAYLAETINQLPDSALKVLGPQGYLRHIHRKTGAVGYRRLKEAGKILPHFDIVSISNEDCNNPYKTVDEWSQIAPRSTFVITRGKEPARVTRNNESFYVPAEPIAVDDTNGCGDTFLSALSIGQYHGMDTKEAVEYAHHAVHDLLAARALNMVQ